MTPPPAARRARTAKAPATPHDAAWVAALRRQLRGWFRRHARALPWRGTRDPYAIWVSEIMLQQTQVATVVGYYERFLRAFPTVAGLAAADEQQVLQLWEGLGYYRRARQLHAAARVIVAEHGGRFPREIDAVRHLPGIGRYTAGAILSIAFDERQPILEANTIRLLSRLLALRDDPRSAAAQARLWQAAEAWLPRREAGLFNQALMEVGSLICTPRDPACDRCPLTRLCPTQAAGLQKQIPRPARRPTIEQVHQAAVVLERNGSVLLIKRGDGDRWAGMWDFPRFELSSEHAAEPQAGIARAFEQQTGFGCRLGSKLVTLRHGVTRFRITLDCYAATPKRSSRAKRMPRARRQDVNSTKTPTRWVPVAELSEVAFNVTARKLANLLQQRHSASHPPS